VVTEFAQRQLTEMDFFSPTDKEVQFVKQRFGAESTKHRVFE